MLVQTRHMLPPTPPNILPNFPLCWHSLSRALARPSVRPSAVATQAEATQAAVKRWSGAPVVTLPHSPACPPVPLAAAAAPSLPQAIRDGAGKKRARAGGRRNNCTHRQRRKGREAKTALVVSIGIASRFWSEHCTVGLFRKFLHCGGGGAPTLRAQNKYYHVLLLATSMSPVNKQSFASFRRPCHSMHTN